MKFLNLALLLSSFLLTACSTTLHKSQQSSSIDIATRSDMSADIEVDMNTVLKGTAQQVTVLGFIDIESANQFADGVTYNGGSSGFTLFSGGIIESTKAAAAFKAVNKQEADVIVAPQYIIKVESKFLGMYKKVTASVSGYAGKIKNIRNTNKR
ncbi:MAG: hypothetical protein K2P81_03620 [Bacteriovoracaceae bacterium]|nr:hypothetical protein [Bacteriovoracaceae bacterium]